MIEGLAARRVPVVVVGTAFFWVILSLNASIPRDFARNQLPWMLAVLPMFIVGAVLALRVPRSRVAWLLFGIAVVASTGTLQGFETWDGLVAGVGAAGSTFAISLLPLLLLVFPDGRLLSRRWLPAAVLTVCTAGLGAVLGLLVGAWGGGAEQAHTFSPFYESTRGFSEVGSAIFFPLYFLTFVSALVSLSMRYRQGETEVRHQLKWLLVGMAFTTVVVIPLLVNWQTSRVATGVNAFLLAAGMASIPIAIGIAVLRYRLYDIDLVISRSLTYGALAVFIGAVYVGVVVGIGALLGQGDRASFALSIVATASVALAFQPVRRWVQQAANRMVFGRRATPYEVLARFSRRAAEASEEELLERIPRLIVDGTGAAEAALWVRSEGEFRAAASWPAGSITHRIAGVDDFDDPQADISLPIHHDDELLGGVSMVTARGETITPSESELMSDLVAGLGLALRNARLTARLRQQVDELERSRDRVVTAADEARRSLEHDLDSGPQQELVALKVKLGPIRKMAEQAGAEKSAEVLAQLEEAAGEAIQSVRDFAGGVYPPLLEAEGLAVAINHQTRKAAIRVSVTSQGLRRYPREVEAAFYFTVLEALQNTTKYASASTAIVSLHDEDGTLSFSVSDDGVGFDPTEVDRGSGLSNMADRMDSIGGDLRIESTSEDGTIVRGSARVAERVPA